MTEKSCSTCKNSFGMTKIDCFDCGDNLSHWTPVSLPASDGSTASYYTLPTGATELQDIISELDLNAQMGEIMRATFRYGKCPHSPKIRDIKKIIFYANAELARLEKLNV